MSVYNFTIVGKLPNLNDYISSMNRNRHVGNKLKSEIQEQIKYEILKQLKNVHIEKQVFITYHFFEPNQKRDLDNVSSFAMKVVQDALVEMKVIENDGWKNIKGFRSSFSVDKLNPRIEIELKEI